MVKTAIKLSEVERGSQLDDLAITAIIQKEIKSRHEAIEDAQKADRTDLIDANEAEIAVLNEFLPKQMTTDEVTDTARSVISEVGATSSADMGKVMKVLLPRIKGRAPGNLVSQIVRQLLQ